MCSYVQVYTLLNVCVRWTSIPIPPHGLKKSYFRSLHHAEIHVVFNLYENLWGIPLTFTISWIKDILKFQSSFNSSFSSTSFRLPLGQYSVKIKIVGHSMQAPIKRTVFSWETSRTCVKELIYRMWLILFPQYWEYQWIFTVLAWSPTVVFYSNQLSSLLLSWLQLWNPDSREFKDQSCMSQYIGDCINGFRAIEANHSKKGRLLKKKKARPRVRTVWRIH